MYDEGYCRSGWRRATGDGDGDGDGWHVVSG